MKTLMPSRRRSRLANMPAHSKEAGLFTSLLVWAFCSGIRAKVLWVVLGTWARLGLSFVLHGLAGTLPNGYAWYLFALLAALTGVLATVVPLQRDARKRSLELLRAGINLGMA